MDQIQKSSLNHEVETMHDMNCTLFFSNIFKTLMHEMRSGKTMKHLQKCQMQLHVCGKFHEIQTQIGDSCMHVHNSTQFFQLMLPLYNHMLMSSRTR